MRTNSTFSSTDGRSTLFWSKWEPAEKPAAILQIVHGMCEHIERYSDFAEYLNSFGIVVVAHDQIGHGKSADATDYGYIGEKDGWKRLADDVEELHKIVKEQYPGVPYFILGHSMGSFTTRAYLSKYGRDLSGTIIMGTGGKRAGLGAGIALCKLIRSLKGSHAKSMLVSGMAFAGNLKRIDKPKTQFDWLTRRDDIVAEYDADPACGFVFAISGYQDLFELLQYINKDECFESAPKNVPLFVVAGSEDPVGSYGKGPAEVCARYANAGFNAKLKLYDGCRHEILNELNADEVYADMKEFILGQI